MEITAGAQLTPNLRLVRLLGEGGMGAVWIADHLTLDTQVAVKFVGDVGAGFREQLVERFTREAKAVAKIRSPHVVQVYDRGVAEGSTPYIVMELLHGESMGERLTREGKLDAPLLVSIMGQVGRALNAAHKAGVIHRDIKPDNIFLVETDEPEPFVKVLDFGIARDVALASATATGTALGTPEFMSPEQLLDAKTVGRSADIWSLAAVAYFGLTGAPAFSGTSLVGLCMAVNAGVFPPPSTHDPRLGAHVDAWFAKALARDPTQRFQTVQELVTGFAALCDPAAAPAAAPPAVLEPATPGLVAGSTVAQAPLAQSPVVGPSSPAVPAPTAQPPSRAVQPPAPQPAAQPAAPPAPPVAVAAPPPAAAYPAGNAQAPQMPTLGAVPRPGTSRTTAVISIGLAVTAVVLAIGVGAWWWLRARPAGDAQPTAAPSVTADSSAPPASASVSTTEPVASASGSASSSAAADGPLVDVPAGDYPLGCHADKNRECFDDEQPGHSTRLAAFAILRHEVTVADYQACVKAGSCPKPGSGKGCGSSGDEAERQPIRCVDWHAATAYCTFRKWRLPTEAEWEAAALGKDHPDYPWGSDPASCPRTVVASADGPGCGTNSPAAVGSHEADRSWAGARDMGGNVREWTSTQYGAYPGGKTDPRTRGKVTRGGSYVMKAGAVDSGHARGADSPRTSRPDLGFRCAVSK